LTRLSSLIEVAAFYGLILAAIWGGQRLGLSGQVWIGAVLLMGAAVYSNRRHGDDRERLGLAAKWLKPAAVSTLKTAGPLLLVLAVWAAMSPPPPLKKLAFWALGYPLWAFAQEYALLAFAANRLRDGLGDRLKTIALVNGLLFAAVHFPNPTLMAACLLSGAAFTWIFLKTPHLAPPALAHALGGALLSWILLHQYNAMMVGPAYWKHALTPGPHP
jgi:membrane protease YdiL (CAAX protease family)